jgi:hypothetical protein
MEVYFKRGQWCARNSSGQLGKFTDKKDAMAFSGKVMKADISHDESDAIEAEKTLAEKMEKAKSKRPKPAVILDDLQGSYE